MRRKTLTLTNQCAPTTYLNSINDPFHKFLNYFQCFDQCYEHVEMHKLLCSLDCTLITVIDVQFYVIDSLSYDVSLE